MNATLLPADEAIDRDSTAGRIALCCNELDESFGAFSETERAEWYDYGLEPAFLHSQFDRLAEEVDRLICDAKLADRGMIDDRASYQGRRGIARSMTALVERYSRLIERVRAASKAAADLQEWGLTETFSELGRRLDESLWFMVVYLQDHWDDSEHARGDVAGR